MTNNIDERTELTHKVNNLSSYGLQQLSAFLSGMEAGKTLQVSAATTQEPPKASEPKGAKEVEVKFPPAIPGRRLGCPGVFLRVSFSYDNMGRLITQTETSLTGAANTVVKSYTYDASGNRKTLTHPQNGISPQRRHSLLHI